MAKAKTGTNVREWERIEHRERAFRALDRRAEMLMGAMSRVTKARPGELKRALLALAASADAVVADLGVVLKARRAS